MGSLVSAAVILLLLLLGLRVATTSNFGNSFPFLRQINAINQPDATPPTHTVGISTIAADPSATGNQAGSQAVGQASYGSSRSQPSSQTDTSTPQGGSSTAPNGQSGGVAAKW